MKGRGQCLPFEPNSPQTAAGLPAASVLDHLRQKQLKDLLDLTGIICQSKAGMIHLLGEEYKASIAHTSQTEVEAPLDACFCSHTIAQKGLFVVPDLREHSLFCDHFLVTREPYLRFYASYPLITSSDENIGALCLSSHVPRQLTGVQQETLCSLAHQIVVHIEVTRHLVALESEIQERNRVVRELEASDSLFRAFLNDSPVSAFIKDEDGRMTYCNKALSDRFGAKPEDWIGKTDFETWPRKIAEEFRRTDMLVIEHNREIHFEDRTLGPDGRMISWDVHKYPFSDASGRRSVACMALDVTPQWEAQQEVQRVQQELHVANEKLRNLSLTDALTGLTNRRAFEDCLEMERARSIRSGDPLSILMMDIDNFKSFNDSFGHVCGDEVLRQIAILMRQWTRQGDLVARYGGEEFLVILPSTDGTVALRIAERLREEIAAAAWRHRSITVSIGVATWHERICANTDFIHEADEALYAAKHNGRNQVCVAECTPAGCNE